MAFFGLFNRNRDDRFRFQIDDRFGLRDGGTVLTGDVLEGAVSVGDEVICLDREGKQLFTCHVAAMEQPGRPVKTASALQRGPYGAHFGILIRGKNKEAYANAAFLVKV